MSELLLLCLVAGRRAAFPAVQVQSVIEIGAVTPVPGAPPHILGLTALRSQALTVIDCALALGLEKDGHRPLGRAAVVEVDGYSYALVVDEAYDVGAALSAPVALPGEFGPGWQRAAVGMIEADGGPALLIDIATVISGPLQDAA